MPARYGSLPFQEQIDFFRSKVPVPTQRWNDLVREQQDAGFMVAGAVKADLLADLRAVVDKAIAGGTTFREFQADFERIVRNRGWTGWRGEKTEAGRAWRAAIIYETNLRTSYQAGRWAQVQAVKGDRPYLIYKHSDAVTHPRPLHLAWDGLIVAADDPWVKPHWPPNGWGCRCRMLSLSADDLRSRGKSGPDTPPDDGTYEWIDRKTGEVHEFPKGIDPFWDYAPGASRTDALRQQLERKAAALPPHLASDLRADVAQLANPAITLDDALRAGREITREIIDAERSTTNRATLLLERLRSDVGIDEAAEVKSTGQGRDLMRAASTRFPDTWTRATDAMGDLYAFASRSRNARGWHRTYRAGDGVDGRRVNLGPGFGVRTIKPGDGFIQARSGDIANAVHEYAHRLQAALPELDSLFQELHRRRTMAAPLERLADLHPRHGYGRDEWTRKDDYLTEYQGKEYGDRGALEVMTMAFQYLLGFDTKSPGTLDEFDRLLTRDREMFELAVGVLFKWKPNIT